MMPNSYPRDGIFNQHLTTIKDSYILTCKHCVYGDTQQDMSRLMTKPETSLGAQPHCWFCHEAAHIYLLTPVYS